MFRQEVWGVLASDESFMMRTGYLFPECLHCFCCSVQCISLSALYSVCLHWAHCMFCELCLCYAWRVCACHWAVWTWEGWGLHKASGSVYIWLWQGAPMGSVVEEDGWMRNRDVYITRAVAWKLSAVGHTGKGLWYNRDPVNSPASPSPCTLASRDLSCLYRGLGGKKR